jgi:hypothetical protein
MDRLDYILDTSNNEDELRVKIKDYVDSTQGQGTYDSILESSDSEEDFIANVKNSARTPLPVSNKENTPAFDVPGLRDISTPENWYGGIKTASDVLGKIPALLTVPVTEAARSVPKYIAENVGRNTSQTPPIDTAAELRQWGVSDRFGLNNLVTDMSNAVGIQGSPVARVQSKDYPKAAAFLQGMTDPVNLAGASVDMIAGSRMPLPKIANAPVMSLEAAANYVRSISKDANLLMQLEKSGRIYDLARMVIAEPEKYLHQFRPNKVYENIQGKILPQEGARLIGDGELANLNRYQNDMLENVPRDKYVVPREELQASAINQLNREGSLEAGQRSSAEDIIRRNIKVMQPDEAKLAKIRLAQAKAEDLKNFQSTTSPKVPNSMYREDLQFLADLPVIQDGADVFPKQRYETSGQVTPPSPEYTPIRPVEELATGTISGYEPSGKVVRPPVEPVPFDSVQEFNPTVSPVEAIKNKNILDILQGKHLAPKYIEDLDRAGKISSMQQELNRLYDPTTPTPEAYTDMVRLRNEEPIGYASEVRRLGNKLMEPPVPGEVSTDLGAKNIAGRAMERAGRLAQEPAMSFMSPGDVADYQSMNTKISNNINLRNLIDKNLVGSDLDGLNIPAGTATGRTGLISTAMEGLRQHVVPTMQESGSRAFNTQANLAGNRRYTQMLGGISSMNSTAENNIRNFKIPMSTEAVSMNPDIVYQKVLKDMGPQAAEMIRNTRSKEELRSVMRLLNQQNPSMFEQTKYNNIDGHIDQEYKQKAINEIVGDKVSSAHVNADRMQLLLHEGKIS